MKKLGAAVGILVLVVVAVVVIFAATFNVNKYRWNDPVATGKRLGRSVVLGDMGLKIFPPRFRVENLAIADDRRFNSECTFHQGARIGCLRPAGTPAA